MSILKLGDSNDGNMGGRVSLFNMCRLASAMYLMVTCLACFADDHIEEEETRGEVQQENTDEYTEPLYEPEVERKAFIEPRIDTEDWELSAYIGTYTFEHYDAKFLSGIRLSRHVSARFFFELNASATKVNQTPQLQLGFQPVFADLNVEMLMLSAGTNLVNGQVFVSEEWAFNSQLYLILGAGVTVFDVVRQEAPNLLRFSKEYNETYRLAVGYRMFVTDWVTTYFEVNDYIVDSSDIHNEKRAHNLAINLGFSFFY